MSSTPQSKAPSPARAVDTAFRGSTRLVAAEAVAKTNARWALPELLGILDDPFLINRRFAQHRLEEWTGKDLRQFGYRLCQLQAERVEPLKTIRAELLRDPVQ